MSTTKFALLLTVLTIYFVTSVVIDSPPLHPPAWKRLTRTNTQKIVKLKFAIKQQNIDILEKRMLEVSTPGHIHYGQHLTSETIHDLLKPTSEAIEAVRNWLHSNGIKKSNIKQLTPNADFLQISVTVAIAEKLLSTTYYDYKNDKFPGMTVSRVNHKQDYEVPVAVAKYLDFISPTKRFPAPLTVSVSKHNLHSSVTDYTPVTPTFLRKLYKVYDTYGTSSSNRQGIASFLEEYFNDDDLTTFWSTYSIDNSLDDVSRVPTSQPSGYGLEAELDVQYITSMGMKIPTQVWYTSGDDIFLTWMLNVINDDDRPHLFSVSYGGYEASVGESYANRLNVEFIKLGAMGISVLFASGDDGAGEYCTPSNDAECPVFPASSPYVTAVGGLYGGSSSGSTTDEIAWEYSGGGFSNYWSTPSWQSSAVSTYLSIANLDLSCSWNEAGRAYPDISAQSVYYTIEWDGGEVYVSGTSCSTPTVGGIFALLNDLRLQNGMSTLGFLNPLIYSVAGSYDDAFNDVVQGNNTGCGGVVYSAVEYWDAVSGWGSPNYEKLAGYVLSYDSLKEKEKDVESVKKEVVIKEKKKGTHHWALTGLGAVL